MRGEKEVEFLSGKYRVEKDVKLRERILIVKLYYLGKVQRDVSFDVGVSLGKVNFWIKRYDAEGFEGLKNKSKRGRDPKIPRKFLKSLRRKLMNRKLEGDVLHAGWNTKEVKELIEKEYGASYCLRHVRRILKNLGFSLITPRINHVKKDKKAQEKFKQEFKKNLRRNTWVIQS